ncbi:MAG: tRNA (adenosine(37)-N6)-threonylcarbamoyltransferase complex ATPase subunit type 1 TsaE [Sterolibacteriaceae bacterium]|uniref:tRNA threonylcarbamoyladenosine biosynthesis protein TsaE n=1 Tax=Candidatus Methylophosphatis roskildensis TaxID=2899263 RepID=A0A9D7HLP7_9PROT|nr:tRNA (adenosine(37)-N6)-threonylcarbamoyltransferase complex ATPase subunit type 1 TsaE [Candidatus Methylophosphatis roskildensis]MBK7237077.1 tRNA (adenosine(37)-N6)-threonylcarbamoyltransferase complex ATPase subunit type 1 TsaE [Sterolibacteriaceae bacterium]MBK7665606.1 tRNA (adenosine(37)-N6)-threonylcarbamoyltransferase complex ATPase subunit type 1 TsaE [Sterolibacteriaceae bacterium]MBK9085849.1 tRNA (adenosine(37)-N6)-threonylcarbamoyltransferase complex ATPase subunit type 1 TsaE [
MAGQLPARLTIWLDGDLGAGKTTLARGLLRALGYGGNVKSPTYTLVELYAISKLNLYHFDFYRLTDPQEFPDAGLDEYFAGDGIRLVEWPGRAAPFVPAADLVVALHVDGAGRRANIHAASRAGVECLRGLRKTLPAGLSSPAASS